MTSQSTLLSNTDYWLKSALEYGILNEADIRVQVEQMEKEKYLAMHPYEIFESAGSWWTYLPSEEGKRKQVKRKSRVDIEKIVVSFYREEDTNPTVREVFNTWNRKRLDDGDIVPSGFCRNEDFYKRHFTNTDMEKRRIKSVTIKEWAEFMKAEVYSKKLKYKAWRGLHSLVFSMLKYAKSEGFIDYQIAEIDEHISFSKNFFRRTERNEAEKELEKEVTAEKDVYTEEELDILLPYLLENLDKHNLGILLDLVIGNRGGEVAGLKNRFVRDGFIMIRYAETRARIDTVKREVLEKEDTVLGDTYCYYVDDVKTAAGERDVVLPKGCEWICDELRKLNPTGEYVFVDEKGKRMTTNCFRKRLENICKKLGIPQKSPHKLRKTYVTILLDALVDKNLVMRQAGHADLRVTEGNYHKDRKSKELKAEILGSIQDFDILKR